MKKTIIVTVVCSLVFAGYIVGQNQTKEKRIENCCCKHTQQIADDLHWIREQMEKPFIPPKPIHSTQGTEPKNPEKINIPKFNFELAEPNFNFPPLPPKPTPPKKR